MTTAVVAATVAADGGGCAALLAAGGETLLSRLVGQLRQRGARRVHVLTRGEWVDSVAADVMADSSVTVHGVGSLADAFAAVADVAASGSSTLLIASGNVITSNDVIDGLLNDPRVRSGALVSGRTAPGPSSLGVRLDRGRVTSAQSPFHTVSRADAAFRGLLKLDGTARAATADVARNIADLLHDGVPPAWEEQWTEHAQRWRPRLPDDSNAAEDVEPGLAPVPERVVAMRDDVVTLLLTGLCRAGVALTASYLRELFWARPFSAAELEQARAQMATVDEDAVRLRSAVKAQDGFFTTFFVSPYSKYIARWASRRGFTPNQITTVSMLIGTVAAVAFASGTRAGLVAGAVLLQLAFTADCVDGQLARYTRQFSSLGAWLDSVFDRGKEYVVFAGLAIGGVRMGQSRAVWTLAAVALALQTARHTLDFSWAASQHQEVAAAPAPPISQPRDQVVEEPALVEADAAPVRPRGVLSAVGSLAIHASRAFERRGWTKWLKRIVVLPIGERFALISVTAALFTPRVTFLALLAWGTVAVLYSLTGRMLRSVV